MLLCLVDRHMQERLRAHSSHVLAFAEAFSASHCRSFGRQEAHEWLHGRWSWYLIFAISRAEWRPHVIKVVHVVLHIWLLEVFLPILDGLRRVDECDANFLAVV